MIDRQIRDVYLERDPMSIAQYAYQTGWSTTTALHCLVTKIEGALVDKEVLLCTFLDVDNTFR